MEQPWVDDWVQHALHWHGYGKRQAFQEMLPLDGPVLTE
jgi:hypothetical protein